MLADAHYLRGLALVDLGEDAGALAELRKAVYLAPQDGFAHFLLAGVLSRLDQAQAEAELASAEATVPALERLVRQTENRLGVLLGRFGGTVERGGERVERLRPAIHRDDQRRAVVRETAQRPGGRAVAFEQPVGDVVSRRDAEIAEQPDEQRGGGRAVHVVVAEHGDGLARLHRVRQPRGGAVHVAEDRRVGHERADGGRAVQVERVAVDASGQQQLRDEIVLVQVMRGEPAPAPWLAGDGRSDVADVG